MAYEDIELNLSAGVATLILNRPASLNALRTQTLEELLDALDRVRDGGDVRTLLITGAGRAFCSGADLSSSKTARSDAPVDGGLVVERFYSPIVERLFALPLPVVAAVNGVAAGAGCSLALCADFVVAARSASFLLAFAKVGLVPDAGITWLLPRTIGRARALRMMMLGERIGAEQALEWGLIHEVVADDEMLASARALAEQLAAGPTLALSLMRQGVRAALDQSLSETLHAEREAQRRASGSLDVREGVRAFLEKRPPAFQGR
jgi:2-(1,2-epoxy-1,2-dihydrophenyl)acetyl-CoA isomerase